jgi:hypothetical protein
MSEINVRPRIREEVELNAKEVQEKLSFHLDTYKDQLITHQKGKHCTVYIAPKIHHFWSPQASINIEETEEGSIVRGLIGPRPNLWATFMVVYIFGFAAFTTSAIIGYSFITMGKSGFMLYLSPVFILLIIANYISMYTGKTLGREQSKLIQDYIHEALVV